MRRTLVAVFCFLFTACTTTRYYIVRHAEKEAAAMSTDVPLSAAGSQRAVALKDALRNKDISRIFSTRFLRTRATAQPLSDATGIHIEPYTPGDTMFITQLKQLNANVLVVGHSNTVDDLVNGLTGRTILQDLPETQYGDLFVVTKCGTKYRYAKKRYGL